MSQGNMTSMFAMRRTIFGSNLLDQIESKNRKDQSKKGAICVGFFPTDYSSFDNRAVSELAISALSVRRKVAVLYLDASIKLDKGEESECEQLENYLGEDGSARVIPAQRYLILKCSTAAPGTSTEITARGLNNVVLQLLESYDLILLVTSDAMTSSLGIAVANACDQCYVFVRQGVTTLGRLEHVRRRLDLTDAKTCGVIYTGRRRLIPDWLYRTLFAGRR